MADDNGQDRTRTPEGERFASEYDDEAFLDAVREYHPRATTAKVREYVGCSHATAFRRLTALFEADRLDREEIGSSYIWSVTDNE